MFKSWNEKVLFLKNINKNIYSASLYEKVLITMNNKGKIYRKEANRRTLETNISE